MYLVTGGTPMQLLAIIETRLIICRLIHALVIGRTTKQNSATNFAVNHSKVG